MDLWESSRALATDPWVTPTFLDGVVSMGSDYGPSISADSLELYFASLRGGGPGSFDLWVATRSDPGVAWEAVALVSGVNSASNDLDPSISADELELYFHSNRPGGMGSNDLWVATRASVDTAWDAPTLAGGLNTSSSDCCPALSADGLALYFASNRPGGAGGDDLWVATRPSPGAAWGAPAALVDLNTADAETGPSISGDNCGVYFASNRNVAAGNLNVWRGDR